MLKIQCFRPANYDSVSPEPRHCIIEMYAYVVSTWTGPPLKVCCMIIEAVILLLGSGIHCAYSVFGHLVKITANNAFVGQIDWFRRTSTKINSQVRNQSEAYTEFQDCNRLKKGKFLEGRWIRCNKMCNQENIMRYERKRLKSTLDSPDAKLSIIWSKHHVL